MAFTPETLEVAGRAEARTLRRSIFEVPVYAARLGSPALCCAAPSPT